MVARLFISGFVQGVGFRRFISNQANELGIFGWVRNAPDNRVEALFQSSVSSDQEAKEAIEKMISLCRKGPFLAEVKEIEVVWEKTERKFKDFSVI